MIACECAVCMSENPRNKRNRPCLLVTTDDDQNILIDTPPELRLAATRFHVNRVHSVLLTHSHADHIFGMDDLRAFNYRQSAPIPVYGEKHTLADVRRVFSYCFEQTQQGGGKPQIELVPIFPGNEYVVSGLKVTPLKVLHGTLPVTAYLLGEHVAYVTDVSEIPNATFDRLRGKDVLFLDAVRRKPHSTHFHLDAALAVIDELRPKQTYLVHLSHDYDHDKTNMELPAGVELAWDGMTVDV